VEGGASFKTECNSIVTLDYREARPFREEVCARSEFTQENSSVEEFDVLSRSLVARGYDAEPRALFRWRVLRSIFSKRSSRGILDVFLALTHGIIRQSIPSHSLATMLAHRLLLRLVQRSCMPESAYDDANPAGMSGSNVRTWSYRIKKADAGFLLEKSGAFENVFSRSAPKINEN
jgi:hypothetical protein